MAQVYFGRFRREIAVRPCVIDALRAEAESAKSLLSPGGGIPVGMLCN